MTKGRRCAPSREKEGIWFQTRGWPRTFENPKPQEKTVTSPSKKFEEKAETPYKRFLFSKHDNRHAFQDHGVYFGNGLGKKILPDRSQHYSNNMITWSMENDQQSNYMVSYRSSTAEGAARRRFPRTHPEGKPGSAPLETTTTNWFRAPYVPHRTQLHVLAITQQPFLPANRWVYSYRPIWS